MAITKAERWGRLHDEALREFDRIQSALRDERLQCLQDRRFYSIAGAQWEGPLGVQFENKPKFEVNKIHLAVMRIISEYRNNRIGASFVSKEGTEKDRLAETCGDLFRADEQYSTAEEAYDNAFEEAVGGGFGAWRLRAAYEDEEDDEDERQRVCIEPIYDADSSVFFDLNAKRYDKSDAKYCFVLTAMTRDAFEDEYGVDATSMPKQIHQRMFDWLTPDVVYVAEYYRVEEVTETVHIFQGVDGEEKRYRDADFDNQPDLEEELAATGYKEARQKKIKTKRVRKYIMCGAQILEDCGYIAGKNIPIVPVYGKRWFVDNVERCMGHVRLAKDSQRLKNMQLSKLGEIAASSSTRKPIFSPEQVAGHQWMWAEDNLKNYPYLLINQLTDQSGNVVSVGPTAYIEPPEVPPAMAALLQITEQDIQDVLGNQQQADKLVSNISAKAIELVQTRVDMQTFIYMSNMAKSIKRSAEIWLSMAKDVFVESGRKMKGIGTGGQVKSVELMRPVMGKEGEIEYENDLAEADFDVAVEVGPSSQSKRAELVRTLTSMIALTQDPQTQKVLTAASLMNLEGDGMADLREYFRKQLVQMGASKPSDEEAQQMAQAAANQQPDANTLYLQAAAQEAMAKAQKAQADTVYTAAKAEETKAKTVETLSNISLAERQQLIDTVSMLAAAQNQPAAPAPIPGAAVEALPPAPNPGETSTEF